MSRYHTLFIGFMLASLLVGICLFVIAMNYVSAAFDCADLTNDWENCASAVRTPIALKAIGIIALWGAALLLLLRERKKQ